jgi:hypothetical protein
MTTPRFTRPLLVAAIFAFAGASGANAVDSKDNAALLYWRAFSLITPERAEALSSIDRAAIGRADFVIEEEAQLDTLRDEGLIQRLIEAASKPECDFAIDYHRGIDALLPHLGPMRKSAILLTLRARLDLAAGDPAHAAACLVAALRSAEHIVDDELMISSLVSNSIVAAAQPVIEFGIGQGAFDAGQRAQLREAVDRFSKSDAFGLLPSMRREKGMVAHWAATQLSGPDAASVLASLAGDDDGESDAVRRAVENDLHGQIALYELFMQKATDALEARDPDALDDIRDAVREGVFGDLTLLIAPSLSPVLRSLTTGDETMNSLRKTLAR